MTPAKAVQTEALLRRAAALLPAGLPDMRRVACECGDVVFSSRSVTTDVCTACGRESRMPTATIHTGPAN